jgi:hypothetical protein
MTVIVVVAVVAVAVVASAQMVFFSLLSTKRLSYFGKRQVSISRLPTQQPVQ